MGDQPPGPLRPLAQPGGGFEHFYGFVAGETNQRYPALYENTTPVEPWSTPEDGYQLMPDLADKAIAWVREQKALAADQPFFVYFAPGATHEPHHVPAEWADRYKGRFDHGWDVQREQTFARQKQLGVIPTDAELTRRHDEVPAWEDMGDQLKPVLAREMEVYAGFLEYADHHIGRVIDALADLEILDDTLVYYIIGDNGASAEGTLQGCFNAAGIVNGPGLETVEYLRERNDQLGGPHPSQGRAAQPVHPRHRRRPDRARGRRAPRTHDRARRHPGTHPGHQHGYSFALEATRYNVFPLDDRVWERLNPDIAGRPGLVQGDTQVLFNGMGRLNENCVLNIRNKSHAVTADTPLPAGTHQVRMEFAYDGGGLGKGGDVTLLVDGQPAGPGRVPRTHPLSFSLDETTDVGRDRSGRRCREPSAAPFITSCPALTDGHCPRSAGWRGMAPWSCCPRREGCRCARMGAHG